MADKYDGINAMEIDVLKEIGSIGGGNAATALSSMLNAKVKMALPDVKILGFNEALRLMGEPEDIVAAIFVQMTDEVEGIMLFLLKEEFSKEVMRRMIGKEDLDFLALDDIETSVLTEVGNIVISSYITAMSSLVDVEVELSVPQFAVNMLGGILSLPMAVMGIDSDKMMMIRGQFTIDGKEVESEMLLLPDIQSLNMLVEKLGVV